MPLPRSRSTRRHLTRAAVAIAALLLTLGVVPPAPASAAADLPKLVRTMANFLDDGIGLPSSMPCPGGRAVRGDAVFGIRVGDTWRGTVVYDYCLTPSLLPDTYTISGLATFTGTIDGCSTGVGPGTIGYVLTDGFASAQLLPLAPNSIMSWKIIPGSATGTLASVIGGSGISLFTTRLPLLSSDGYFAGSQLC